MPTLADIVNKASMTYGVSTSLIYAVIRAESGGNPNARSSAGAMGLMQLMPATAAGLGVTNPYDPTQNVMGGTKFLAELSKMFGGNTSLIAAGYNAGPGAVQKYGGIPPYQQTQTYVKEILSYMGQGVSNTLQSTNIGTTQSTARPAQPQQQLPPKKLISTSAAPTTTTTGTAAPTTTTTGTAATSGGYTITTPLGPVNIPNPLSGVNWVDVGLIVGGAILFIIGIAIFIYASRKPATAIIQAGAKVAEIATLL